MTHLDEDVTKVIYETKGRAREYSELACNIYRGCDHGCIYCYVPHTLHLERGDFQKPSQRQDNIQSLATQAASRRAAGETRPVLLCFTCDPYQHLDIELGLTRQAIEVLHFYGFPVKILTKGGRRAERDFGLLSPHDSFGVTLTVGHSEAGYWERYAALPGERVLSLIHAKERGIPTWVSLEPVIYPEHSLDWIKATHHFVDHFKVGKMNYHPVSRSVDWHKFAHEVKDLLESLGCSYYLKKDLEWYL